ncbi:MAG: DNA-protecting protein DprA [Candidatus Liptonbacteria bacterium]|nr:DNA-protecting protein DprA [Candidatus Liptonbacteria bacterium]
MNPGVVFYNAINLLNQGDYRKNAKIKDRFGDWEKAWNALGGGTGIEVEREWKKLEKGGVRLLIQEDAAYPKLLREIPQSPFGIYVLGTIPDDSLPPVAIVGTRKATYDGKALAKQFASELARNGFAIVSGLALGLDAAAHEGCLNGGGKAVAVLANGLDQICPRTNERLAKKIIESGGAVISEYPLGSEVFQYRFLERNRIVSGLSRGTLVIEAPKHSGSLVTARLALEQNREVFVVPGPVNHPNFYGSNQLIRAGAELVTKSEEILQAFGIETASTKGSLAHLETEEEKRVFAALAKIGAPADVDKLTELTNLNTSDINKALTFLIMKDVVRETAQGYATNAQSV